MKFFNLIVTLSVLVFSQTGFARETLLKLNELSLNQDLYNAKMKKTVAEAQIKISENEVKRQADIFAQIYAISKAQPQAVSEEEYKQAEVAVKVAEFNVLEAKELLASSKIDIAIYERYLEQARGEKVTATELAKLYLAMWTARNKAAQYAVSKNEAELALAVYEQDLVARLVAKNAETLKNLIIADRDLTKAQESLVRAKEALQVTVEAMKKFD